MNPRFVTARTMEYGRFIQRAKVYSLNDEGNWDDKGTGHVSVEYLESSEAVGLIVIDEEDGATLLAHRISADDIYRRAQETIISWRDPEAAADLALSFQETMCCSYIWDQICEVRRSIQFPVSVGGLDVGSRSTNEFEHLSASQGNDGANTEVLELPNVELSSLHQILKILTETSVSFLDREQINSNFIMKLVDLFTTCEDLENVEGLHTLFKIAKAIVSLNDGHIFDIIFSDKFIIDFIGMLEYDPDVVSRQDHRSFLKNQVIFKEVVPIPDSHILAKIHQTYRIGYIKDVILPNILDNPTASSLNSMILNNNVMVVSVLLDHSTFIKDLFGELKSTNLEQSKKMDLVQFLQEFCSLSKSLQLPLRTLLFRGNGIALLSCGKHLNEKPSDLLIPLDDTIGKLFPPPVCSSFVQEGLFSVATDLLGNAEESLRLKGADILVMVLNFDASLLRKFLVHQTGQALFGFLVTGLLTSGPGGVQSQILEVMRMLLECETTERLPGLDKNHFLDIFYEKYMDQIMKILPSTVTSKKTKDTDTKEFCAANSVSAEVLANICELLCFSIQHHAHRIRGYITRNHIMEKVLQLTTRKEKHLVVAAVRVLRTCIGRKDEVYNRYIVKHDLFGPVVQAFLANGNRYNLLNSAVLELFHSLIKDNVKSLIFYVTEKYYDKLETIDYVDTFKKIKIKYDQASEGLITREDSGAVNSRERVGLARDRMDGFLDTRRRKDDRALDKDEEEYFNEDSDEEEDTASVQTIALTRKTSQAMTVNGSLLSGSFGLVDYDDDEDDAPTVQNNGNEESSIVVGAAVSNDSVWLDREEDEMIQNVKRKKSVPLTGSRESEPKALKRRKIAVPSNLEKVPASYQEKSESCKSSPSQQESKHGKSVEEAHRSDHAGADDLQEADSIRPVTNGPSYIKAHEVAGS